MQDHDAIVIEERPAAAKGRIDLDRYRGRGKKMFPNIDAQEYIRELRDCDRLPDDALVIAPGPL